MYFLLLIGQALLVLFEAFFLRANISRLVRWVNFLVQNVSFKKALRTFYLPSISLFTLSNVITFSSFLFWFFGPVKYSNLSILSSKCICFSNA